MYTGVRRRARGLLPCRQTGGHRRPCLHTLLPGQEPLAPARPGGNALTPALVLSAVAADARDIRRRRALLPHPGARAPRAPQRHGAGRRGPALS